MRQFFEANARVCLPLLGKAVKLSFSALPETLVSRVPFGTGVERPSFQQVSWGLLRPLRIYHTGILFRLILLSQV